jgi:hypothetical protein
VFHPQTGACSGLHFAWVSLGFLEQVITCPSCTVHVFPREF